MPQIDTSMYPQAQPPANPLQTMAGLVQLQGGMLSNQHAGLQNQLLSKTMAANAAQSQAYAHHIGADGSPDIGGALSEMAGNPDAQFNLQEAASVAMAQKRQQIETGLTQLHSMWNTAGALADDPNASFEKAREGISQLVAAKVISPAQAADEINKVPKDPNEIRQWARTHQMQAQEAAQQLADYHANTFVDTGPNIQQQNVAPLAAPVAPIAKGLDPSAAAQPVAGPVNPDGSPTTVPLGQRAGMGKVTVGQGPAAQAAGAQSGAGNAQQGLALQTQAQEMPGIKAILGHMGGDLKYFQSGPGAAEWKSLMAGASRLGIPVDKNAVASQENFNKFAAMLAQRQFGMLGGTGSDKQLVSSIEANPNQTLTNEGNRRMIAILKGNADAMTTANQAWQRWQSLGKGSETFGQFMAKFNDNFDPRIFQMQYMSKDEKARMLGGMSKAEQDKFKQQYNKAAERGWIGR